MNYSFNASQLSQHEEQKYNERNTSKPFYLPNQRVIHKGSTNVDMPWRVPRLYHLFLFVLHNDGASSALGAIEGPVFHKFKLIFSQLNTENRTKQHEPTRAGADGGGMHGDRGDHTPFQLAHRGHMFTKQNKSSRLVSSLVFLLYFVVLVDSQKSCSIVPAQQVWFHIEIWGLVAGMSWIEFHAASLF